MTAREKQIALARYRIQQAEETIDDAEFLLSGNKSPRSIMNRAYYGMFYAVLALLIFEPYASSKHSGVLAYFNREFIKKRIFPEDMGRAINTAFELRQRADYREYADITFEQAEPYINRSRIFVGAIKEYLESNIFRMG